MTTETEIKLYVPDLAAVEDRLRHAGASLQSARVYERNVRYEDAQNSLTPASRVLRLRQDQRVRITYKEPHPDGVQGRGLTRTEIEITVDNYDMADLLLQKLGFRPAWIYEKYRTTYTLNDSEIVLDETPLGHFVEIEGGNIDAALEALGLTDLHGIHHSYSELFFMVKERLGLPFNDLTFDNFTGITVPADVFAVDT
jgi:adenylate cyclase, class 2